MEAGDKKRKIAWSVFAIAAGILITFMVLYFTRESVPIDKHLAVAASELNKTLPMMVDASTRLDNVLALPDRVMVYNYTAVKIEIVQADSNTFKDNLRPKLINIIKTTPEMKFFRDEDVTFVYLYRREDGSYLFSVIVDPSQYK